jgi:hypothetical protein
MEIKRTGEIRARLNGLIDLLQSADTQVLEFSIEQPIVDICDGMRLVAQDPIGYLEIRMKIFNPDLKQGTAEKDKEKHV